MPLIIPSNSISAGGYVVDNSCRFNDGSSDYLERTAGSTGNRKTLTISYWLKRGNITTANSQGVLNAGILSDGNNHSFCGFQSSTDTAIIQTTTSGSNVMSLQSNALFRDVSAWYHFVWKVDTTQGTESNRIKLYVNGVEHSLTGTFPSLNQDTWFNYADTHTVGTRFTNYLNGYLTEMILIDGTALDPTSFGEFDEDSGIWKPIDVSGLTFGTNGFYLDFENSGSLGADVSGNGNNFTVNNLTAIDQTTDTPTNNFCTPNPLYPQRGGGVTFSEGNLKTVFTSYEQSPNGTIGASAGKWYYEMKMSGTHARFGWCESHCPQGDTDSNSTFPAYAIYSNGSNGLRVYKNVTTRVVTDYTGYTNWSAGDTVGIAFDIDNGKFYAHLNGTYYNSGDPANGTGALITGITAQQGGLFLPYLNCGTNLSRTFEWNFGSPSHTISSGNTDGNGYGNFEYAVPSGYLSLCTKNLSEVLG